MPGYELTQGTPPEDWLAEAFAQRLAEALELMTGETPQVAWRSAEQLEWPPDLLWWEQPLNLGKSFVVWIGAPEASWQEIGRHVLHAAGMEQSDASDVRNTYLEILGQALSSLARDIGTRVRQEVTCELGSEAQPPAGTPLAAVDVILALDQALTLWFTPASALVELLAGPAGGSVQQTAGQQQAMSGEDLTGPPLPVAEAPAGPNQKTLELLLEVEMPVSVSFGRTQLPLRDVLKLTTGSIIELNRTVAEPVEIVVNNCVIARGEVVVTEGNYGVRIHEIVSRQERLRTLR